MCIRDSAKAIYQKYLGWYDANPVNLDPLPPSDAAKKLVEYLGSTCLLYTSRCV